MRIKRGTVSHRKHKKLLESVKGYRMSKHRLVKVAKEAYLHAGVYALDGRRKKKSQFRRLWITRISQAVREYGLNYNGFINKLSKAKIILDRKILSELVLNDKPAFEKIIDIVKKV